ncbi:SNF2-related protein [Marinilabiliaceae bacterium ANBcel2]|nr:SNF2-related protein [Marinilabiliaceae bacterium ANBcel2]
MDNTSNSNLASGMRITIRDEDFIITKTDQNIVEAEGISELVKGMKFSFDLNLEDVEVITPEKTRLVPDTSNGYRKTKLFVETVLRNSSFYSGGIEIAHKAAIHPSNYQFIPTLKALKLPKPRFLIADGVGLGKTIQAGIFLTEMVRRNKGQRVLVVTPKSILAQFQQEIWTRFSIPLVRLDSLGVAKISDMIPANKNPFEYYDKVIVSIDTLKNNAKFLHHLEKIRWHVVIIDECHTVANDDSERGKLAKFLSQRSEALILASATPHNGKKKNFTNLLNLIDPTAVPYNGEFTKEDIKPFFERRFKKDIADEVGDQFKERITTSYHCDLFPEEVEVLQIIQNAKNEAFEKAEGKMNDGLLLFTIGLFKSYMSSPAACLETIKNRLYKEKDDEIAKDFLQDLEQRIEHILKHGKDGKLQGFIEKLKEKKWAGEKTDDRIIVFAERIKTLEYLVEQLRNTFTIEEKSIVKFDGGLTDVDQQEIIDDFAKEDSSVRLFISSDAGSQGVNLHYHCHIMYNYDIPWSIITLEQRNGRIDRFGQTREPEIYYLISRTDNQGIRDDFRILEKLTEKEQEVQKSLGDAGSLWMLYDTKKEENKVLKAYAKGDATELDKADKDDEVDWDFFNENDDEVFAEQDKIFEDKPGSFFDNDFEFYVNLIKTLQAENDHFQDKIYLDKESKTIEFALDEELSRKGVLYDLPDEAFPLKRNTFKLTTDKDLVEKAIAKARKKKENPWPDLQLLYDLHPIARWLQFKILALIDKGNAPVVRMRSPLPEKSAWFVFQGITSNTKGQSILSRSFVVGRSFIGQQVGSMDSFDDFLQNYRLFDDLPDIEIENTHIDLMQSMLPDAVKSARKLYETTWQGSLRDEVEEKLGVYEKKLNKWLQDSERQLELQFGDDFSGTLKVHKNKRKKDIEYLRQETSGFYQTCFQLDNEPFFRLLAVFYNA